MIDNGPPPPPEESSQFARCGGLLARGRRPRRLPGRASPEPVAVAADSPLTVAGAAPVSHRTSLSHRKDDASTRNRLVTCSPLFSLVGPAYPAPSNRGGADEDRGWLPLRQGALFGRCRAGFRRRVPLQELPERYRDRLCHRRGAANAGTECAGHAADVHRSGRQRQSNLSALLPGMRIGAHRRGRGHAERHDDHGRYARRRELGKAGDGDLLRQRPAMGSSSAATDSAFRKCRADLDAGSEKLWLRRGR